MFRTREELLAELEHAREAVDTALRALVAAASNPQGANEERRALDAAELTLGALYRELATVSGEEYVVPLALGFRPEAAVSGAFVLQDEHRTFLTFNAMGNGPDGRAVRRGTAVVEFQGALSTKFGLPNDEALRGHPLHGRGLDFYSIGEVLNFRWAREAERQNRVAFPNARPWGVRHFVLTFHDSTFECLASGLAFELTTRTHSEVVADLYAKLGAGGQAE